MNYAVFIPFTESIIEGLMVTLFITVGSTIMGTLLGLVIAPILAAPEKNASFRIMTSLVEIIRAVPPLVWLMWVYFAIPILIDIRLSPLVSAMVVFTLIYAAFAADIFRGAIRAIPKHTIDAALSIGMTPSIMRSRVIFTEIFRRSFPALNGQTIGFLKMSSLASIIAVPELTYAFQIILIKKPLPFEVYTGMALAYCAIIFPSVWLLRKVEKLNFLSLNPVSNAASK